MKVGELIEWLQQEDPAAEVYLLSQPGWPFEYALAGVTTRAEVDDDFVHNLIPDGPEPRRRDVLLVEGQQVRYGSKAAWKAIEKRSRVIWDDDELEVYQWDER